MFWGLKSGNILKIQNILLSRRKILSDSIIIIMKMVSKKGLFYCHLFYEEREKTQDYHTPLQFTVKSLILLSYRDSLYSPLIATNRLTRETFHK